MPNPRVAALAVIVATALGCAPENQYQAPPPPEVTVAAPLRMSIHEVVETTGRAEAKESVEIRARVQGFLESVHFEEGQEVEAGDLLFVIDPKPLQADLDAANASVGVAQAHVGSAQAALVQAEARAANALAQYRRAERAAQGGAVTQAELDDLRTQVDTANADVEVAKADITSAEAELTTTEANRNHAKLDFEYTQVRSPIAGRVGRKQVDIGNLVGANDATVLTRVVQYDPIYVYFTVPESDFIAHLREEANDPSAVDISHVKERKRVVRVGLAGDVGYPFEGLMDYADLDIDPSTGTYLLRAVFDNPNSLIPPGAFANVQVVLDEVEATLIDNAAIGRDQSGPYVIVLNDEDVAQRRGVELGRRYDGGLRVVTAGLNPDDRVVVNGIQRARPGTKVRPSVREAAAGEG